MTNPVIPAIINREMNRTFKIVPIGTLFKNFLAILPS
jgi:hypothetical protein